MRKSTSGSGFLIQDDYPPRSATAVGQAVAVPVVLSRNEQIANKLNWVAFALLAFGVISPTILLWLWVYCDQHQYDSGFGGRETASQYIAMLHTVWLGAMLCPFGAIVVCLLSFIHRPNLRAIAVCILSLGWGYAFLLFNAQNIDILFKMSWVAA